MSLSNFWQYLLSLSWATASNGVVAIVAGVASFGAIRMMDKNTNQAMRCGFVTLAVGLIGYGLSTFVSESWQPGFDALLVGGSLALFIGSRRNAGLLLRATLLSKLSMVVTLYSWLLFFLTVK